MSSRPALGVQQPPAQHRIAGGVRAPNRSRLAAQINTALHNARKPPPVLTVDLTGDADKMAKAGASAAPGEGSSHMTASPVVVGHNSPSHRESAGRRARPQQLHPGEPATVRPSAIERQPSFGASVPFPPRPGHNKPEDFLQADGLPGEIIVTAVGKGEGKKHGFEAPPISRRFPDNKCADFSPWHGNHHEDQLSEQIVKSGFQNKPLVSNETNTARPSLWNHLKNKQGLTTLSQLFVSVLEKRQAAGRLTASSTFKPPPRIVFTAARREQWLQELANPAVALRRFSKTIPHGIVGKGLLDACLSNNIPLARAVWLAKCVGSNELRSLKRKGTNASAPMGNEHKWVREWTVSVEQWIEGVLGLCGEDNWSVKIHYAVRLSATLYNEQLLEQDHFLTWIVASLEGSSIDRLPFWLLLVQTYWKYLVASRKRGKRLSEAIFTWLHVTSEDLSAELLKPVRQRLRQLATTLAVMHKGCMILPNIWTQYKAFLLPDTQTAKMAFSSSAIEDLTRRNDRLAKPAGGVAAEGKTPRKILFNALDTADARVSFDQLYQTCTTAVDDRRLLSRLVIQWASSIYRDGNHRVYIASRILRKCSHDGADIDSILLDFVADPPSAHSVDFLFVFKLAGELVRSQHFSVSHFFQSLIATGTLSTHWNARDALPKPLASPLLLNHLQPQERLALLAVAIPTDHLPEHVSTLKSLILEDAGAAIAAEAATVQQTIDMLRVQFPTSETRIDIGRALLHLSPSAKSAVSNWIRSYIRTWCASSEKHRDTMIPNATISHQFQVAREALEQMEDFPMLADVLGLTTGIADADALASVTETLHMHLECFAAVGALIPLYKAVLERYQMLRGQELLVKQLIYAIRDLSSALGLNRPLIQQLSVDFSRCAQRDTVAMCSPASDSAIDTIQVGVDTDDEIERILSSGTTMDEQIMSRLFMRIVGRAEKNDPDQRARAGVWLSRLQSFDVLTFNRLMAEWIAALLTTARPVALELLPTLISCGCISMPAFVQCADKCQRDKGATFSCYLDLDILDAIFADSHAPRMSRAQDAYRDRLERKKYTAMSSSDILDRLQRVIAPAARADPNVADRISSLLATPAFVSFVRRLAVEKEQTLALTMGLTGSEASPTNLDVAERVLAALMDPSDQQGLLELPHNERVPKLLLTADELSLPFCQLLMRCLLLQDSANGRKSDAAAKMFEAISQAADKDDCVWAELVQNFDNRITQQIRQVAESKLFAAIPSSKQGSEGAPTSEDITKLLRIVDSTCPVPQSQSSHNTIPILSEKLRHLFDLLNSESAQLGKEQPGTEPQSLRNDVQQLCVHLCAVLHLATLYKLSTAASSKSSSELPAFLVILTGFLVHPRLQFSRSILEYVFDVTAYFSDDLTEDQRAQLAKNEFAKTTDPRITFLFGIYQPADAWLGLVTSSNATATTAPSSTPNAPPTPTIPRPGPPHPSRQPATSHSRQVVSSPVHQRPTGGAAQPSKTFNPPVPYPLRHWEIIDLGGSAHNTNSLHHQAGAPINDTAISLTLFGARKVG